MNPRSASSTEVKKNTNVCKDFPISEVIYKGRVYQLSNFTLRSNFLPYPKRLLKVD